MFVHHTATANGYTEAPEVIRSVCAYHVFSLGWHDIAYNFLIDRFGNTYEGRAGGVTQAIYGGHKGLQLLLERGGAHRRAHIVRPQPGRPRVARAPPGSVRSEPRRPNRIVHRHVARLGDLPLRGHGDSPQHRRAPRRPGDQLPGRRLLRAAPSIRQAVEKRGGAKIYGGFPDIEPTPYREDMVFHLGFTERMIWSFRLSDNVDGSTLVSRSGTGTAATITWDRKRHNSYVEPGWYPVEFTAETPDGGHRARRALRCLPTAVRRRRRSIHEFSIEDIAEAGITVGCGGTRYCPNRAVTRGQMASFLTRALDLPPSPDDWFDDDDDSVHDEAIDSIAEAGSPRGSPTGPSGLIWRSPGVRWRASGKGARPAALS